MNTHCITNLHDLSKLLSAIKASDYTHKSQLLFGSSIGQHIRHIIEFYQCLVYAIITQTSINYDNRKRNLALETDPIKALSAINNLSELIEVYQKDQAILLEGNFGLEDDKPTQIQSSYRRELAYCLEHSIHHQALIKIGLKELNLLHLIDQNFGIAPATIRHLQTVK